MVDVTVFVCCAGGVFSVMPAHEQADLYSLILWQYVAYAGTLLGVMSGQIGFGLRFLISLSSVGKACGIVTVAKGSSWRTVRFAGPSGSVIVVCSVTVVVFSGQPQ